MRPVSQRFSVAGVGAPIMLNYIQTSFAVGLWLYFTGTTLLATVQISGDDPTTNRRQPTSLTRVAALATMVDNGHNLVTGSTIFVGGAGAPFDTPAIGADVTVVDANTYTYAVANSGPLAAQVGIQVSHLRWFNHATMAAMAASTNGNLAFPTRACRLNVATLTAGFVDFLVLQGASAS